MKKITKRVLLEEIQRINEIMKGSSKLILNEQPSEFIEKLFRGSEEEVSNLVKSIEKSGLRGADDIASAFRSLVERGLTKLTEEESMFLANIIRQVYPEVSTTLRRELSSLLVPKYGPVNVARFEEILADPKRSTKSLYDYITKQLGMENLTVLELQVWRDALKRTPSEIKIPTTVEVKPKPENITPPTELNLTPEQKRNCRTGLTHWDVINGITDFASHNYGYEKKPNSDRHLQVQAGDMLARTPDTANLILNQPF